MYPIVFIAPSDAISWICVFVFLIAALIALYALWKKISTGGRNSEYYTKTLFTSLIVGVVSIGVGVFREKMGKDHPPPPPPPPQSIEIKLKDVLPSHLSAQRLAQYPDSAKAGLQRVGEIKLEVKGSSLEFSVEFHVQSAGVEYETISYRKTLMDVGPNKTIRFLDGTTAKSSPLNGSGEGAIEVPKNEFIRGGSASVFQHAGGTNLDGLVFAEKIDVKAVDVLVKKSAFTVVGQPNGSYGPREVAAGADGLCEIAAESGAGSPNSFRSLSLNSNIPNVQFRYRVRTNQNLAEEWIQDGRVAPPVPGGHIYAIEIRLIGSESDLYRVDYETTTGFFGDGTLDSPVITTGGEWNESKSARANDKEHSWLYKIGVRVMKKEPRTRISANKWSDLMSTLKAQGKAGFEPMELRYDTKDGFVIELERTGGKWEFKTIDGTDHPIGPWEQVNPGFHLLALRRPPDLRFGVGKRRTEL